MRTFICLAVLALAWSSTAFAQVKINETIATKSNQEIYFKLDRPDVVFKTWNKNEIQIRGAVSINNGKNDDAFNLTVDRDGGEIVIETDIENECKLPKMISAEKNGEKIYLGTTKAYNLDWDALKEEHNGELDNINIGVLVEAKFEVMIPKNIELNVKSKFGDIVINDFYNELNVKTTHGGIDVVFSQTPTRSVSLASTHGHVDVSIPKNAKLDMELKTSHGEILTDLDLDIRGNDGRGGSNRRSNSCSSNKNTIAATYNGGGTEMELRSTHDNVYLRELK